MRILRQNTVRVYHTTRVENLESIFRDGLQTKYQKDREFENRILHLGLTQKPLIYLSKDINHLCIPAVENKRVVLQVDIPKSIFNKWNRENKGDPMYNWFIKNRYKFNNDFTEFCRWMYEQIIGYDKKLEEKMNLEKREYGSLENTPRFKHTVNSIKAMSPDCCLCIYENIPPEWINHEILTERDLSKLGIYFGR